MRKTTTYGYHIEWRDTIFDKKVVRVSGFLWPQQAEDAAFKIAIECGFRLPHWWEFWRWWDDFHPVISLTAEEEG